jgi:hypothetical protein
MTLFCPKCNATLPIAQERDVIQVCPICSHQVSIDYDLTGAVPTDHDLTEAARRKEELERKMQAEIVKIQEQDLRIGSNLRNRIQPRLLGVADKFQFHIGIDSFPNPTREQVIELTGLLFSNNTQSVMDLLDQYGVESFEQQKERVQLAVLKLANGNFSKFAETLSTAKFDFRDVLLLAESPSCVSLGAFKWAAQLSEIQLAETAESDLTQYLTWLDTILAAGNAAKRSGFFRWLSWLR